MEHLNLGLPNGANLLSASSRRSTRSTRTANRYNNGRTSRGRGSRGRGSRGAAPKHSLRVKPLNENSLRFTIKANRNPNVKVKPLNENAAGLPISLQTLASRGDIKRHLRHLAKSAKNKKHFNNNGYVGNRVKSASERKLIKNQLRIPANMNTREPYLRGLVYQELAELTPRQKAKMNRQSARINAMAHKLFLQNKAKKLP